MQPFCPARRNGARSRGPATPQGKHFSLLSAAMAQTRETVDPTDPQADHTIRLAIAWQSLVENSNILSALSRFEARYSRLYHRTLAELEARANITKRTPELLDSATSAPLHLVSVVDTREPGK